MRKRLDDDNRWRAQVHFTWCRYMLILPGINRCAIYIAATWDSCKSKNPSAGRGEESRYLLWCQISWSFIISFHKVQCPEISFQYFILCLPESPIPISPSYFKWEAFMKLSTSNYIMCPNHHNLLSCTLHLIPLVPNLSHNTLTLCHTCTLTLHIQWNRLVSFIPI